MSNNPLPTPLAAPLSPVHSPLSLPSSVGPAVLPSSSTSALLAPSASIHPSTLHTPPQHPHTTPSVSGLLSSSPSAAVALDSVDLPVSHFWNTSVAASTTPHTHYTTSQTHSPSSSTPSASNPALAAFDSASLSSSAAASSAVSSAAAEADFAKSQGERSRLDPTESSQPPLREAENASPSRKMTFSVGGRAESGEENNATIGGVSGPTLLDHRAGLTMAREGAVSDSPYTVAAAANAATSPLLSTSAPPNLAAPLPPSSPHPLQHAGASGRGQGASASSSARSSSLLAGLQAVFERAKLNQNSTFPRASFTSASVSASSSASTCIDHVCHCLVVDEARLPAGQADSLRQALVLNNDRAALRSFLLDRFKDTLPQLDSMLSIAYVTSSPSPRLHLNFRSLPVLAAALKECGWLIRCGSTVGPAWSNRPCGPAKHELPELIELSCVPLRPKALSELDGDVKALLSSMGFRTTAHWTRLPDSMQPSSAGRHNNSSSSKRLRINVLARDIALVSSVVEKHHLQFELWGGKVKVQALNQPQLRRCSQCDALGHDAAHCNRYSGLAIRLLFRSPLSFAAMQQWQELTSAKNAFLGSSLDEVQPSRRLTLQQVIF